MSFDLSLYVDVQDRITRFWQEYPEGAIRTEHRGPSENFKETRYIACVYRKHTDPWPAATGWAFEIAGQGHVNRTSHEENCETSAIGRALANLGYATTREDRPSRQEMGKVQRMQDEPRRMEPRERAQVDATYEQVSRATSPAPDGHGKNIRGPAPRALNKGQLIKALQMDGWNIAEGAGVKQIAQDIEFQYDGEAIPTNESGSYWPSDIWDFVAQQNEREAETANA